MGELGEVLERMISFAFAKVGIRSPLIQEHPWSIAFCVLGIPIVWMLSRDYLLPQIMSPATPPPRAYLSDYPDFRPTWNKVINTLAQHNLGLPVGLRIPVFLSLVALAVAIFTKLPYDFYVLFRVLICLTAISVMVTLRRRSSLGAWFWVMCAIALVYNPLLALRLHRETWAVVNLATMPVFVGLFLLISRRA